MAEKEIDVAFALYDKDGSYWVNTAVAMASVGMHSSKRLHFHVLHDETLKPAARSRLEHIARRLGHRLTLRHCQAPPIFASSTFTRFSVAANYRLMLPRLLADSDLVIYLDSDLVSNGLDIVELAQALRPDAALAAVIDPHIARPASHRESLQRLALDPAEYVNSGVLAMRPRMIPEDLLEVYAQLQPRVGHMPHGDQDFINVHFRGRIQRLDERFNFQACPFERMLFQPLHVYQGKIVHYAGKIKPLDSVLSQGLLPFWMHAGLVPELADVLRTARPMHYLFPDATAAGKVHLRPVAAVRQSQ